MQSRDPKLQEFLTSLGEALRGSALADEGAASLDRIYGALDGPSPGGRPDPRRLPVCGHLPEALATARAGSGVVARVAEAFAALEPWLAWMPRVASGPFASDNWPDGHANAMVVGPKGLESRHDVQVGVSLLAPNVRYPDHSHAPEEVYLVLSPGRFQHGDSGWFEPGLGGSLYNEPDIKHAMASDAAPLLAFWCLWTGRPAHG